MSPRKPRLAAYLQLANRADVPDPVEGTTVLYADTEGNLQRAGADGGGGPVSSDGLTTLDFTTPLPLDFAEADLMQVVATGPVTISALNLAADGRAVTLIIDGTGLALDAALTLPVGARWVGTALTAIPAGALCMLTLTSRTALASGLVVVGAVEDV
jgi:hypothetical protein